MLSELELTDQSPSMAHGICGLLEGAYSRMPAAAVVQLFNICALPITTNTISVLQGAREPLLEVHWKERLVVEHKIKPMLSTSSIG